MSLSPMEAAVGSGNDKSLECIACCPQPIGMGEEETDDVTLLTIAGILRTGIFDGLAIGQRTCHESQPTSHLLFVLRVDVVSFADIDGRCQTTVGHRLRHLQLRLAQLSPGRLLGGVGLWRHVVGQLNDIEGEGATAVGGSCETGAPVVDEYG